MNEEEFIRLLRKLLLKQVRQAVQVLLEGNDTCCFTIEQFQKSYKKSAQINDPKYLPDLDEARQLLEMSRMVQEVRPGIWAAKDFTKI